MQQLKQQLRFEIKTKLKALDKEAVLLKSHQLLEKLKPLISNAKKIAIYHALPIEISLYPLIKDCLANTKQLYQPLAYKENRHMLFIPYNENNRDIFMPLDYIPEQQEAWYNLDLIFVPLTAADKFGHRLGKGGGYYDATLVKSNAVSSYPILCGVGFDCQYVDHVPAESFDIQLDYFVSETRLIKF